MLVDASLWYVDGCKLRNSEEVSIGLHGLYRES